jgi:hypothetical protein
MNAISFEKGKIAFQLFFIVLFQWTSTSCQLSLYNTDQTFKSNSLQFDCLNYHVYREKLAYQELSDIVDEVIPYCFRPTNNFDESFKVFVDSLSQKLSFERIRMANITSQQLLSWSIPIEVVERYQLYLNEPNSSLNEHFYNCIERRFGLQCQYSFAFDEGMSFDQIVEADFRGRIGYFHEKVDCFDEGADEESCFDMEINECNEDEYRCHNGLCISQELWEDGMGDTDCLDRSDRAIDFFYINSCFQDPTFRCEEHSCGTNVNPFSCGDGQCLLTFEGCHNGRHVLLIDSMTAQGNLTYECWVAMICFTGLAKEANENLCEIWPTNESTVYKALQQCSSFFQFPIIPVYSDHVRFFYKDPHSRSSETGVLLPDYVCYDGKLCDFKISSFVHENLTYVEKPESILILDITESLWAELMLSAEQYFRSCSISHVILDTKKKYSDYSSLYSCQNSSKFISKHRIMDTMQDCYEGDNENYQNSCLLNDPYRVKCRKPTKCWSPLVKYDACALNSVEYPGEIPFQSVCDGFDNYFYEDNGQEHTDEFGCENGLCNNMYTHCDGFWACSDGQDEYNCNRTICPLGTYACISSVNYSVICLFSTYVNDRTVHCLGALDEQLECRSAYPWEENSYPFRCSDDYECVQASEVCNKEDDCPSGDDEGEFCKNQQLTCDQGLTHNRSDLEKVLCELNEDERAAKTSTYNLHSLFSFVKYVSSTKQECLFSKSE